MTARTSDALASAPEFPTLDQIQRIARAIGGNEFHSWDDLPPEAQGRCIDSAVRVLAALAEAGYVLVHTAPDDATVERPDGGDEYHSLDELYEYRMLYNAHAAQGWFTAGHPVVKSWRHSDGEECFGGGWFIVVAVLPTGQVSNHYEAQHWDLFRIPAVTTPPQYDGHTPQIAAERLRAALADTPAQARQPTQESGMHEHARNAAGYCMTCDAGPRSASAEPRPPEWSMLEHAAELIITTQFGSTSFLKRKLDIGHAVASQLMNRLDELGVVGPQVGSKAREVLVPPHQLPDVLTRIRAQARHTAGEAAGGGEDG